MPQPPARTRDGPPSGPAGGGPPGKGLAPPRGQPHQIVRGGGGARGGAARKDLVGIYNAIYKLYTAYTRPSSGTGHTRVRPGNRVSLGISPVP